MKRSILTLTVIFILALTLTSPVIAENVFRWASQGDAVTSTRTRPICPRPSFNSNKYTNP